jgi:hypothetical protein
LIRASHFSALSSSTGRLYPDFALKNGYPGHPIGLASFWHDSDQPWLEQVKVLFFTFCEDMKNWTYF